MSYTPQCFIQAFIALGSNLGNPQLQIRQAMSELDQLPATHLLKCSSLYNSAPVGNTDQPDFINAVVQIKTNLRPYNLLQALLAIEHCHGRTRETRNAPRTLDLDILIYGDLQCHEQDLILPHPRMTQRAFVLVPLMEIASDCYIPGQGTITELLAKCPKQRLVRIP